MKINEKLNFQFQCKCTQLCSTIRRTATTLINLKVLINYYFKSLLLCKIKKISKFETKKLILFFLVTCNVFRFLKYESRKSSSFL